MKTRRKSPVNLVATEPHPCSIDLRMQILERLPFFNGLSRKAVEAINQRFVEVGYQNGECIYTAGDPACVLNIRSESFHQVPDEFPELALKMLEVMVARLNDANQRVLQLNSMPVEKRIAMPL